MSQQRNLAVIVGSALLVFGGITALIHYERIYYFGMAVYSAINTSSMAPLNPSVRYSSWLFYEASTIAALWGMPIIGAAILRRPQRIVGGLLTLAGIELISTLAKLNWEKGLQSGAGYSWSVQAWIWR